MVAEPRAGDDELRGVQMATSDGISSQDWDVIHRFAVDIVNAPDDEKPEYSKRLVDYLDNLERKYGPLPSILATRADYLPEDDPARKDLLLRAYGSAQASGDSQNQLLVAQSLAELHLDKVELFDANRWLEQMRSHLIASNSADYREYDRLKANYRKLALRKA